MKQIKLVVSILAAAIIVAPVTAWAQSSSSSNYKVDQTFFGTGGELENSSATYKAKSSVGELGVGNFSSASYQAFAGFNTTDDPYLEFVVVANNIDLGYLDTAAPKTAVGLFSVRAWQAGGYAVVTGSDPPTNPSGGHQIAPMTSGGASTPGTEQFGINLKANTSPTITGSSDPIQTNSMAFGVAAAGYNTANTFRYNKGEKIAESLTSTSVTNYTVSYLFNINNVTPSGQYTFRHVLIATGTY